MLKSSAILLRLVGLFGFAATSQLVIAQKDLYPFGYLDSAAIVKIDSRIGASKAEMECLNEIRLGRSEAVVKRCRKFIDAKRDDMVAWFLLIDSTLQSNGSIDPLLHELATLSHSGTGENLGQRFRLLLWHAYRLTVTRTDPKHSDLGASQKYATARQLEYPSFAPLTGSVYRPASACEAFLLFDCLNQTGDGMQRRDLLRYSVKKFRDYRLNLMLARSLDQASGAYLTVPASGGSPKEGLQIAKAAHIEHPQDPVATYMYGMLLSERRQKGSVAVLQKYLKMDDVSERRRSKAKAALAEMRAKA